MKSAVELLATGQAAQAFDLLQQQGRVREIPEHDERIHTIAGIYAESPVNMLIVPPDNASRRELNLAVREELKARHTVAAEDHCSRVLMQRQDMTGADRAWANHYDVGDVVRYTRGSKNVGIEAGSHPPYHPRMMAKVLLYGYCVGGVLLATAGERLVEDIAFRVLAAGNEPDFRTIAELRKIHLKALEGLFGQVLRIALKLGAMRLGRVAIDGTKMKANASKHKAMSTGG